jgi:hypothetical protein
VTAPTGPAGRPARRQLAPGRLVWLAGVVLAFPAALGVFWLARDTGASRPLCGDRPGSHYPAACQLPAPFGSGPPTTTAGGFQP